MNSLGQFDRFRGAFDNPRRIGLRINPGLSLVDDVRYDPCRKASKLGTPIRDLRRRLEAEPDFLEGIGGLHFHTNCDCESFGPLLETAGRIKKKLGGHLEALEWINLGGGYAIEAEDRESLAKRRRSFAIAAKSTFISSPAPLSYATRAIS